MKRVKLSFYIAIAVLMLGACSGEPTEAPERPPRPGEPVEEPEPDYSAVLTDGALRFECDTLRISFEDIGVLYSIEDQRHRFIDTATGVSASIDLADTTVRVNGVRKPVERVKTIGSVGDVNFYAIEPGPMFFVVER